MVREGEDRYSIDLLIAGICKRPAMYVMGGQFSDVVNFLYGFYTGLARSETEAAEVARFNGFYDWLCEKFDCPNSVPIWNLFRSRYPDDAGALEQLATYWCEYNAQRGR